MNGDHIEGGFDDAKDNVKAAAEEVAGQAAEAVSGAAAEAGSRLHHTADTLRAKAGAVGGRVCEAGTSACDCVAHTVRQQPWLALLGAAAIGCLAGYLLHGQSTPAPAEPRYRRMVRHWG